MLHREPGPVNTHPSPWAPTFARWLQALVTALHLARSEDPEAAFITGYQSLLRAVAERPSSWQVVFSASPDPAVIDRFTRVRAQLGDAITAGISPVLTRWWGLDDAQAKLPILVEFFVSTCEAAVRSLLDDTNPWGAEQLGDLYGRMVCTVFSAVEPKTVFGSAPSD